MTDNNTSERKPLILIAEDVESNYKLLEIILKKEYDLLWAKNGKEAVAYALSHNPDAVLMDIKMPVMDGIEALKEIRLHTDSLPVIMQTAYAFDTDRRVEEMNQRSFHRKTVAGNPFAVDVQPPRGDAREVVRGAEPHPFGPGEVGAFGEERTDRGRQRVGYDRQVSGRPHRSRHRAVGICASDAGQRASARAYGQLGA